MLLTNTNDLEKYFFYRLIKVAYICALLFFSSLMLMFGYSARPIQLTNNENSYIICKSGNIYSLSEKNIYMSSEQILDADDDKKITNVCSYYVPNLADVKEIEGISKLTQFRQKHPEYNNLPDSELIETIYKRYYSDMPKDVFLQKLGLVRTDFSHNPKNYQLSLSQTTEGSWSFLSLWWLIGISTVYITLNLIKEAILYIGLGKKFSWEWINIISKIKLILLKSRQ